MDNIIKALDAELKKRALQDPLFAKKMKASGKTAQGAYNYLYEIAKKSKKNNCCVFSPTEAENHIMHYFDEDSLNYEKSKPTDVKAEVKKAEPKPSNVLDLFSQPDTASKPTASKPKEIKKESKEPNQAIQLSLF